MQITLENVSKVFDSQRAVDDVSFTAGVGITGFLGPNGAGKSTTMRMITGFLEPSAGTIKIDGADAWPSTPEVRSKIGYLPEHNPLYPDMYVKEYLSFIARVHRLPGISDRVNEAVAKVGLEREQHKIIGTLSKGYRQRVGLAQALLHDPPILILDEPTSGFDPNQLREIREVIRELGKSKIVLLSTHIMQEVQALCERVLIINRGKLVADEPTERLGSRLAGESIVTILCQKSPDKGMLLTLPGVTSVEIAGKSARMSIAGTKELRPQIAALCSQQQWGLLELNGANPSVEDAFQAITRTSEVNANG